MLKQILIIDDNEINRLLLSQIVQDEYDVLEAQNGEEGLSVLKEKSKEIDAILLDIMMPVMDGFTFLTHVKDNAEYAQIPVIITTSIGEIEGETKALSLGANDFITKPFNPAIVKHSIRNAINLREISSIVRILQLDQLTGLYTREAFFERAAAMIREKEAGYYIFACFDIDNFKVLNDQFGQIEGNKILQTIGKVAKLTFQTVEGVCGHISGDVFAAIYPNQEDKRLFVAQTQENWMKNLESPASVVFSLGLCVVSDPTLPISSIYDRAFIAKQSVKGRYDLHTGFFDESMLKQLVTEQSIINEMDQALEERQFEIWFQPQFNHSTGRLVGAEALVRWRHPQKGLMPPGIFIPLFEQNGFIYELDKYVWEEACFCLKKWQEQGKEPLPVSVNISRYDIFRADLVEIFSSLIEKYHLNPNLLKLEITESAFSKSADQIIDVVKRLRAKGFTLEIDDFGSGYSSLNTLKDVPADVLKLDMRFLESKENSERGGNIVESIVRMAKWLNMTVIAEGVETQQQADFLKSIGCNYVQGYFYAKPMPIGDYEALVEKHSKEKHLFALKTLTTFDNQAFWNPSSLDTLIFNSYVGGACVMETFNHEVHILRANEQYAKIICGPEATIDQALRIVWKDHLSEEDRIKSRTVISEAISTDTEKSMELAFIVNPPEEKKKYFNINLKVIARTSDRYLLYFTIEDLTEKREAEKAFLENELKLKKLNEKILADNKTMQNFMDDTPGNFIRLKSENNCPFYIVYANSNFEVLTGYTKEELSTKGLDPLNVVHPDDIVHLTEEMNKAISSTERLSETPFRIKKKDGTFVWVNASARFTTGVNGERNINAYLTDLSEKEKKTLEIQKTVPLILSALMESSSDYAFAKDMEFRYICGSRSFATLVGFDSPKELEGKTDFDIFGKTMAQKFRHDDMLLLKKNNSIIDMIEHIPSKDGVPHYSKTSKFILRDSSGNQIGIFGIGRDVTQSRTEQNRLQLLTNSIPGGLATVSLELDGSIKFLYFNDGLCRLFGFTREELSLQGNEIFTSHVFEEDRVLFLEGLENLKKFDKPLNLSFRIHSKSGYVVWLNLMAISAERTGEALIINAVFYDITKQKEDEQKQLSLQNQLKTILQNVRGGISAITYENGKVEFIFANEQYWNLFGYSENEFKTELTNGFLDLVLPQDLAKVKQALIMENEGQSCIIDFRVKKRNGKIIWLNTKNTTCRFDGIPSIVHLAVIQDATDEIETHNEILNLNRNLSELMDNMPGGFARLRVTGEKTVSGVFANEMCYKKMLGFETFEEFKLRFKSPFDYIAPQDIPTINQTLGILQSHWDHVELRFHLQKKDNSYLPILAVARPSKNTEGEFFINVFFTDLTQQMKAEERRKALLDNLPCGAAYYELEGKTLTAINLNKRYMELLNRSIEDPTKSSVNKSMPTVDWQNLHKELSSAIAEKRDISIDIRLRCGDGSFKPFHVSGRILEERNGKKPIFATFSPINDSEITAREIIPHALSVMMQSSSDMNFIKDKNLRYLCCSHSFALAAGFKDESEVVGKTDFEFIDPALATRYLAMDYQVIKLGKPILGYSEAIPAEGNTTRYSTTSKYPLKDSFGNIIGLYGVGRDITEYRQAFEQLKLVTNSIPGGIAKIEFFPASKTMKMLYFNEGFYGFSGFSHEEFQKMTEGEPMALVVPEDRYKIVNACLALYANPGTTASCSYRSPVKGGTVRWFSASLSAESFSEVKITANIMKLDITDLNEATEKLRISEEQFRIAIELSGRFVARYDIKKRILYHSIPLLFSMGYSSIIENVPQTLMERGLVESQSQNDFQDFFDRIRGGQPKAFFTCSLLSQNSTYRWYRMEGNTIFDSSGKPSEAVMVFYDVTEDIEKETVFRKWKLSLEDRSKNTYSLFQCNISKDIGSDSIEGTLIQMRIPRGKTSFIANVEQYLNNYVYPSDRDKFASVLDRDSLLSGFYKGKRTEVLEFRELLENKDFRWLRLTVELVEFPNSTEIEAYLMFEDIDQSKREDLLVRKNAEKDPLTGVLNRTTFENKVNELLQQSGPQSLGAFFILDIDGFKLVNDSFGHAAGDKALVDLSDSVRSILRKADLLGRLGGDEFLIFLENLPDIDAIQTKAKQICSVIRQTFSLDITISASMGIALSPHDGNTFSSLYKKADTALYHVKETGKDSFAFFRENMKEGTIKVSSISKNQENTNEKPHILAVDDDYVSLELLKSVLSDSYNVDSVSSGREALIKLRRNSYYSAVLLDLMMPGVNGFDVLKSMQNNIELHEIPVIVISGINEQEICIQAIRSGATDFVTKPYDSDLLLLRLSSVIAQKESIKLKNQTRFLAIQGYEISKYRSIVEKNGISMVEFNHQTQLFTYDNSIFDHIAGKFDQRPLWDILLQDANADFKETEKLKTLVLVEKDHSTNLTLNLQTPSGEMHSFAVEIIVMKNQNLSVITFRA